MRRFESHYRLRDDDNLEARRLNAILADIDARVAAGEDLRSVIEQAISDLNKVGLDRLNSVLTPQIERIQLAGELGFLVISSATPHSLVQGNIVTFTVEEGARRELYHPTTFVSITRKATPDDGAIGLVHGYDVEHGELLVELVTVFGDPGPHSDWEIAASAGAAVAQLQMLDETRSARDEAVSAKDDAEAAAAIASGAADTATGAAVTAGAQAGAATTKAGEAAAHADAAEGWAATAAGHAASVDTAAIDASIAEAELRAAAHARRMAIRFSAAR